MVTRPREVRRSADLHTHTWCESEMKQKLDEEGSKCSILAKHRKFVECCCMRCCAPFTFLVNTRRRCSDCKFNVCKGCCSFLKREKAWVCCVCQQARLLRTQSLEWFYSNVKSRFKRFGSAKVLKNLYRKHRLETGACLDVLGGGFSESHLEKDGSISGSDSTFYRQSEGHSMMDTVAVALRVAEEAIEEAICKAEAHVDSLDKQNEATYLRDHREELTEELAATILQKIIRKRKSRSEQHTEEKPEEPQPQGLSLKAEGSMAAPRGPWVPTTLWRSQPAFSFPGEDSQKTAALEAAARRCPGQPCALPSWKSVDGLDGTNAAPVLQSPDGNWVALKGSVAPPACLLATQKSTALQALEVSSPAASAYEKLGSGCEEDFDWNADLSKLCLQAQGADHRAPATSPSPGASPNPEAMGSDSETSSAGSSRDAGCRASFWPPRRGSRNPAAEQLRLQGELDVNFNLQAASGETSDSSEAEEASQATDWRARQWRRAHLNTKELGTEQCAPNTCTQDLHTSQVPSDLSETDISTEAADSRTSSDTAEEKRRSRLYELALKMSEKETSSGEDPESDPKTGPENQKESLSAEENTQSVQDELRKSAGHSQLVGRHASPRESEVEQRLVPHPSALSGPRPQCRAKGAVRPRASWVDLSQLPDSGSRDLEAVVPGPAESGTGSQPNLKYSAVSLCNISTEVLKVITATEELIAESTGPWELPPVPAGREEGTFPLGTSQARLEEQLTHLEENVYLAAGTVYGLEGQLTELEDAARSIHSGTQDTELAELEDQVAAAAAQVHHAELQISDIESRISALTLAGLNIAPCVHLSRKQEQRRRNQVQTIDTSRQQRRKLPAPPVKAETIEASSVTTIKMFNRNFILQGSSTSRRTDSGTQDPMIIHFLSIRGAFVKIGFVPAYTGKLETLPDTGAELCPATTVLNGTGTVAQGSARCRPQEPALESAVMY
ncbi:Rab effector MyRIP [Fukomys damarensis]|uniref:Rab effector MyRIP n=1 Tax=Fukomys damarensis TaxID=885580 RepID=A0A091DS74_FUKDA|nr:Rab effector MyRIP [Fukomys damarensis]